MKFNPSCYSNEEHTFLLTHLGEAPNVAFHDGIPDGVVVKQVSPLLQEVFDLEQVREKRGVEWVGIDAIKSMIRTYKREREKWEAAHKKGAPRFPSLYSFNGKGKPQWGGIGSDAHIVQSYFDDRGKRHSLVMDLDGSDDTTGWAAPWASENTVPTELLEDYDRNLFGCKLCGHTVTFKPDSPASERAAHARMAKHLKGASDNKQEHLEYYANVYRS